MPKAHLRAGELVKQCTKCGETKAAGEFFRRSAAHSRDGLNSWCKPCTTAAKWVSVAKNGTHYALMRAEYKARTRGHRLAIAKVYRAKRQHTVSRLHKYGLTVAQYDEMRKAQDYRCYICRTHESDSRGGVLCVDHNHETLHVRDLLCHHCNAAYGQMREDPALLQRLIDYHRRHLPAAL